MNKKQPKLDYQLVVIGAGPAGMSAALQASKLGLEVAVFDMQPAPGGQIYRNIESNNDSYEELIDILGKSYFEGQSLVSDFRNANLDYFPGSTVWHLRADGAVGVQVNGSSYLINSKRVVVACGAMERPAPFPGWTLPGVMGAGAAQTLMKSSQAVPSGRTLIAGTGPLAVLVAYQLLKMRVDIGGLLLTSNFQIKPRNISLLIKAWPEAQELLKGMFWLAELARSIPIFTSIDHLSATGTKHLEGVTFTAKGKEHTLSAETLLVHDGIVPLFELMADAGCKLDWHGTENYWQPQTNEWGQTTCPRLFAAGDAQGVAGAKAARIRGAISALEVSMQEGMISREERDSIALPMQKQLKKNLSLRPVMVSQFPEGLATNQLAADTILCRCEEISLQAVRDAQVSGATTMDRIKAVTRCGMGPCQGKMCASTLSRILSSEGNSTFEMVGTYRARFPGRPISIGQLASMRVAPQFSKNAKLLNEIDKPQLVEGTP